VARTGSGYILGDETDSVGAFSGGLATETDSVGILASGGIATETDIMGHSAPGRSLYTEYTVYRYTYLDRLSLACHTNCISWGVTSALGVTLPPPSQGFVLGPKFINPDCYSLFVKNQKT